MVSGLLAALGPGVTSIESAASVKLPLPAEALAIAAVFPLQTRAPLPTLEA